MSYSLRIYKLLKGQSLDTQRRLLYIAQLVDQNTKTDQDKPPTGKTYTVKAGDTLSGIAEDLYGRSDAWPQLYSENKDVVGQDPNIIEPGMILQLPTSLRPLTPQERSMMQQQSQKMHDQLLPKSNNAEDIKLEAENRGLVALSDLPIKSSTRSANSVYADPRLKNLLAEIQNGVSDQNGPIKAPLDRITEAWPPTVRHMSHSHYTGGALDFTVHPNSSLSEIRRLVKYMQNRGFRVANEYEETYSTTTGKHIHVAVSSPPKANLAANMQTNKRRGA